LSLDKAIGNSPSWLINSFGDTKDYTIP